MVNYFITGTSKGLGRAIAEEALHNGGNVIGVARSNAGKAIVHNNYNHVPLDLGNIPLLLENVHQLFSILPEAEKIVLINNAGTLGTVGKLGDLNGADIENVYAVNLVAPAILINAFLAAYRAYTCKKIIVNISSGAAKNPSDGWSGYCASKAGLEMLSRVAAKEESLWLNNIAIYSFDPFVVDTPMQTELRSVSEQDFSRVKQFKHLNETNKLLDPRDVAEKIIAVVENPERFDNAILSVQDVA